MTLPLLNMYLLFPYRVFSLPRASYYNKNNNDTNINKKTCSFGDTKTDQLQYCN